MKLIIKDSERKERVIDYSKLSREQIERRVSQYERRHGSFEIFAKQYNCDEGNTEKSVKEKKPFVFRLTREKLEEYRGMSPEAKLRWLEEANRFIQKFVSVDQLTRWKKVSGREQE